MTAKRLSLPLSNVTWTCTNISCFVSVGYRHIASRAAPRGLKLELQRVGMSPDEWEEEEDEEESANCWDTPPVQTYSFTHFRGFFSFFLSLLAGVLYDPFNARHESEVTALASPLRLSFSFFRFLVAVFFSFFSLNY